MSETLELVGFVVLGVGVLVVGVGLWIHTWERHRSPWKAREIVRAIDGSKTHVFVPIEQGAHRCLCGRAVDHDIHTREGGVG